MTDETFSDEDMEEVGRLAYAAVLRRLRDDEVTPVGITALSKFAAWFREEAEERKRREEANRPNPAANVAAADDFLEALRQMHKDGRITAARLSEVMPSYVLLLEEHLELARSFQKELAAESSPNDGADSDGS
jgi:hypothetical protein